MLFCDDTSLPRGEMLSRGRESCNQDASWSWGPLTCCLTQISPAQRPLSCLARAHTLQRTMGRHSHQAKIVPLRIGRHPHSFGTRGSGRMGEQEGNQGGGTLGPPEAQGQRHRDQESPAGERQSQKALCTALWMPVGP